MRARDRVGQLLLVAVALGAAGAARAKPAGEARAVRRDLARQRGKAARLEAILRRAALPPVFRRAPGRIVTRAARRCRGLIESGGWSRQGADPSRLRRGHAKLRLTSDAGDLQLRFASERLEAGSRVPGAPAMAELSYVTRRASGGTRFDAEVQRLEVYTAEGGRRPWREGPASVALTRARMHQDGFGRALTKEARSLGQGAWIVETSLVTRRFDPSTGEAPGGEAVRRQRYDLYTPDGTRARVPLAVGRLIWSGR